MCCYCHPKRNTANYKESWLQTSRVPPLFITLDNQARIHLDM